MPLYAWGSNGSGQLGLPHTNDISTPTLCTVPSHETPLSVSAGGNHTLIHYPSGLVASLGVVSGLPGKNLCATHNVSVKFCAATWDASILCTRPGREIITFGKGEKGELGRGEGVTWFEWRGENGEGVDGSSSEGGGRTELHGGGGGGIDLSPLLSPGVEIVQLAGGVQHVVAVLSNGDVVGWGNGRKGQLGEPAEVVWTPRRVERIGFRVVRAVCAQGFTVLIGKSGECLVLGQDKFGVVSDAPRYVPGWRDVGASWGSVFVLCEDGRIVSWGRDDHGQLAGREMVDIEQMAVGSEHALVLDKHGKLYAWGWGEHGNCGPDIDENGDVKMPKEIALPVGIGKIQGIGAGCATSWSWT